MTFNLGKVRQQSRPRNLRSLAQSLGCRITALAISPTDSDMAVASTAGEIHIKRLAGDTGFNIPDTADHHH